MEVRMGLMSRLFGPRAPRVQPTHADDASFTSEVLRSKVPVVVDFWSPGCAPCRMLEPVLMDLAADYAGRVKVVEVNAAEAERTAARLGVMGTPTVLFFRSGREVERVVGFVGSRFLREIVDSELLDERAA
jgi:thioredoxin 1